MQFCTACGAPLRGAEFCTACGQRAVRASEAPEDGPSGTAELPPLPPLLPLQPVAAPAYARPLRPRGPLVAGVVAVVLVAVGAGVTAWLALSRDDGTGATAHPGPSVSQSVTTSVSTPAGPSPTALPTTQAGIQFAAVRTNADLAAIAPVLDTYFSGVNDHDASAAISVFSPLGASNPNDPKNVDQLASGIQTTTDDEIAVTGITGSVFPTVAGHSTATTAVTVRFRSRQDAAQGYHGQTCSLWSITYHLIDVEPWTSLQGPTHFRILGSKADVPVSC